jgi:hypothetical protein
MMQVMLLVALLLVRGVFYYMKFFEKKLLFFGRRPSYAKASAGDAEGRDERH